jgi:hypothetical protein
LPESIPVHRHLHDAGVNATQSISAVSAKPDWGFPYSDFPGKIASSSFVAQLAMVMSSNTASNWGQALVFVSWTKI